MSPFLSAAQQRLMFSKESPIGPKAAQEWASKTDFSRLPERVGGEPEAGESKAHEKGESKREERQEHRKVHDRRTLQGKKAAMDAAAKALKVGPKKRGGC